MQREVIRPLVDQPVVVKLDQADGVEREGKFGVDFQYTVNDDAGVMWLPPAARDALLRIGAQAGDSVEIVKSKKGSQYVYSVRRVGDAHEPPRPAGNGKIPPRAYYQPGVNGNGHTTTNGNGHSAPAAPANGSSSLLARCFHEALDAINDAELYAKERHGLDLEFQAEDIRACALSLYINETRGNR